MVFVSILLIVIITEINNFCYSQIITDDPCINIYPLCYEQLNCQDCIRAHSCCNWCYDKDFNGNRCNILNNLKQCKLQGLMKNEETRNEVVSDKPFKDYEESDGKEFVQFKPQEFNLALRKGEPENLTLVYQPAKNYPLELYYLMDLTQSMKADLFTMTQLGINLTQTLSTLTSSYKIAFGSYVDKKAMPFYLTDRINYQNPCTVIGLNCEEGYLFKHHLNFTAEIDKFIDNIKQSKLSGNLDNLEGGLDALMQISVCGKRLGWSKNSRKLVVLATDSPMHLAGDGLLIGATKKLPIKCLMDFKGNHLEPLNYDYPSLEELHNQLRHAKINIIYAIKALNIKFYEEIEKLIPEASFVGELEDDSTNILRLVRDGYYDFMRRVQLSVNTSDVDGLEVVFYVDCDGNGIFEKSDTCLNAEEGKPIVYKIQFELKKHTDRKYIILYAEERNLQERVTINMNFIGSKCDCKNIDKIAPCVHGEQTCGLCKCHEGWSGNLCDETCDTHVDICRYTSETGISSTCSGNGDCICGKCDCYFPYTGKYCQDLCPHNIVEHKICGGHGFCQDNMCECDADFGGDDCTCSKLQNECIIPGINSLCNGHGTCECNQCKCDHGYSGKFCEHCDVCLGLCNAYLPCVIEVIENSNATCVKEQTVIETHIVDNLNLDDNNKKNRQICHYSYTQKDGNKCLADYTYQIMSDLLVRLDIVNQCGNAQMANILGISAIILILGLFVVGLVIWKMVVTRKDRLEYESFLSEQNYAQKHTEQNPLYKSPIKIYENPMEMENFQSSTHIKDD